MPRPHPPPTPGSSADMRAQDGSDPAPPFHLPPTAFPHADRASTSASASSPAASDSSYRPVSPASPLEQPRKRAPSTQHDFALPPPPTRSRKIIQMKPQQAAQPPTASGPAHTAGKTAGNGQAGSGKRKQGNNTTAAAGRKIARKTAHSLIERRRRSKMNEEFGVLRDMIPACNGQEMHKLAILQASTDYLRYLEQCVQDLQAQTASAKPRPAPSGRASAQAGDNEDEGDEMDEDGDEAEAAAALTPPTITTHEHSNSLVSLPSLSQAITNSPSLFGPGAGGRHYSLSSASQASYSPYIHSAQTSPAFGPQLQHVSTAPGLGNGFGLGSPALQPLEKTQLAAGAEGLGARRGSGVFGGDGRSRSEQELDQEATAALLMLNHDRRNWGVGQQRSLGGGSAISVRELLSG